MKSLTKLDRLLVLLASLAVLGILAYYGAPEAAADHCSRGQGTLSGPAIGGVNPAGKAEWQGNAFCQPLEMQVEVSKVNLADGTILAVDACGSGGVTNFIGTIALRGGSGKLQLSRQNGDNVPFCDMRFGGNVEVLRGEAVILSGCVSSKDIPGAPQC